MTQRPIQRRRFAQSVIADLVWGEVRAPNPLFEGDTVYSVSEVLDTRLSRSRTDLIVRTNGWNQHGVPIITSRPTVMIYRGGCRLMHSVRSA